VEKRDRFVMGFAVFALVVSVVVAVLTMCSGCSTVCEATMGAVDGARHDYHATVKALHRDVEADEARDGKTDASK
jgi:uncharacterized protein YceK